MKKKLKIKTITYSRIRNLGNYENERIEATADVSSVEDQDVTLSRLKYWVDKKLYCTCSKRPFCECECDY